MDKEENWTEIVQFAFSLLVKSSVYSLFYSFLWGKGKVEIS